MGPIMLGLTLKRGGKRQAVKFANDAESPTQGARRGIVAGTRIATAQGWRPVEAIASGDMVLTFDRGLQPVLEVRRSTLLPSGDSRDWPLEVPAGALGNAERVLLAPRQQIVVESDVAEARYGDPFVAIPALALDDTRGIAPVFPRHGTELITLCFSGEEVVFGAAGALFFCPSGGDIFSDMSDRERYVTLTVEQAFDVVESIQSAPMYTEQMVAAEVA